MRTPVVTCGLIVTVCGLSCSTAHGILVPQLGIESTSLALRGRFLITGPPGKFPEDFHHSRYTSKIYQSLELADLVLCSSLKNLEGRLDWGEPGGQGIRDSWQFHVFCQGLPWGCHFRDILGLLLSLSFKWLFVARLPGVANKNTGHPIKCAFYVNIRCHFLVYVSYNILPDFTTLLTIYIFLISCSILKGLQPPQVGGDKGWCDNTIITSGEVFTLGPKCSTS